MSHHHKRISRFESFVVFLISAAFLLPRRNIFMGLCVRRYSPTLDHTVPRIVHEYRIFFYSVWRLHNDIMIELEFWYYICLISCAWFFSSRDVIYLWTPLFLLLTKTRSSKCTTWAGFFCSYRVMPNIVVTEWIESMALFDALNWGIQLNSLHYKWSGS